MDACAEVPGKPDEEVWAALAESISNVTEIDRGLITFTTSFREDIQIDSIDMVEVLANVEDSLGVSLDDLEFQKIATVGDVYRMLADKAQANYLSAGQAVGHADPG